MSTKSRSIFCILAVMLISMMFVGVASAGIHGKAPPGQVIVLTDNPDYLVNDLGSTASANFVGTTNTVSPAGAISAIVGIPSTGAGTNYTATSSTDVEQLQGTTISGVTTASKAGRSFCGVGKVFTGDFARACPLRTRTVSLGDDVRDRT